MLRRAAAVDYLTLVNAERPWRPDERLRLVPVNRQDKGVMLQSEAACQLNRLLQQLTGSAEAGWQQIAAVSGWRSRQEQRRIWWQSLAENGREFTEQYVARPGCSEHQTGLAIDLGLRLPEIDFIRPYFPYDGLAGRFRRLRESTSQGPPAGYTYIGPYPPEEGSSCLIWTSCRCRARYCGGS